MERTSKINLDLINNILTITWRVLGVLLVFPLALILSVENLLLFLVVFLQYQIVYRIVLLGIPNGFKELTERANDVKDFKAEFKLFVLSLLLVLLFSVGGFFLLRWSHNVVPYDYMINDIIRINKWLSITVVLSSLLSVVQAYLKPRIDEFYTLGNVIYRGVILLFTLISILLYLSRGTNVVYVISIGLLVSSVVTLIYYGAFFYNQFTDIRYSYNYETKDSQAKLWQLLVYLFKNSLPYVLLYSMMPLYRLFDVYVLQLIIPETTVIEETVKYQFNVYYILSIAIVLLTLLGSTYIKRVGKDFSINNLSGVDKNINRTIHLVLYFGLPLMAFTMIFPNQIYGLLFTETQVMLTAAPFIVLIPIAVLSSQMVTMINKTTYLWYSLTFGFVIKLITSYAISIYMGVHGAVIATHLGLLSTIFINLVVLNGITMFDAKYLLKRIGYLAGITTIMSVALVFVDRLLISTIDYSVSLMNNLLYLLITFVIAVVLYFVMSLYTGLIQIVSDSDLTWWDIYDQVEEWEDDELLW